MNNICVYIVLYMFIYLYIITFIEQNQYKFIFLLINGIAYRISNDLFRIYFLNLKIYTIII